MQHTLGLLITNAQHTGPHILIRLKDIHICAPLESELDDLRTNSIDVTARLDRIRADRPGVVNSHASFKQTGV